MKWALLRVPALPLLEHALSYTGGVAPMSRPIAYNPTQEEIRHRKLVMAAMAVCSSGGITYSSYEMNRLRSVVEECLENEELDDLG